tara:strand:- start:3064 stop:3336 length:273 start_codon:yes stop_codon:yes gene_type:complete
MSKISSYGIVSPPVAGDLVIGTNVRDANKTKNFTVDSVAALAKEVGVLNLPAHANQAAAISAGLLAGALYQTSGTGAAPLNAAGIVIVVQ